MLSDIGEVTSLVSPPGSNVIEPLNDEHITVA